MMKLSKVLIMGFVAYTVLVGSSSVPFAEKGDVNISWKGETLSADLVGVPLQGVLEHLSKARGIWFQVHESVADQNITVHFEELSFEEGLKRILARMDYSLEFDSNGMPTGVVIMGEKAGTHNAGKGPTAPDPGPEPEFPETEPPALHDSTEAESVESPFGPTPPTPEELEQFKVIRNSPPPGGVPEVTEEELKQFKVIRNSPPPGGPPTATPEELEHFKVRRNSPPPGE